MSGTRTMTETIRTKTLTINQIKKGNKGLCLSAKRALKLCHRCKSYPRCESKIVNQEYERLSQDKENLTKEFKEKLNKIEEAIERI